MSTFFMLTFLASLGLLVVGLIKPSGVSKLFRKPMGRKAVGLVFGVAAFASIIGGSIVTPHQSTKTPLNTTPVASVLSDTTSTPAKQPVITTKTTTETQIIPFDKKTVNDPTLAQGTTKVTTPGVNGVKTLTYTITYSDGAQTDKQLTKEEITTQPVTQITSVGTKAPVAYSPPATPSPSPAPSPAPASTSCPDGYYLNTYGNCIHSPSTNPTGATARCNDGTYSYSQTHSGTCSHHGGVAEWL